MSGLPDLSDLLADRPSVSPGTKRKSVSFGGGSSSGDKDAQKQQKAYEKALKKPLTKEATAHVMETMGDALRNPEKLSQTMGDNKDLYWKIQAYKRAFKDRIHFNNRVTRESDNGVLAKELESIQSQLSSRNGHAAMSQLFSLGGDILGMGLSTYNPTGYDINGLPQKWSKAMAEGYFEDEIVELSIKYGDWLSQGPEIRSLFKVINLLKVVDAENKLRTGGGGESLRRPASINITGNPAFNDL